MARHPAGPAGGARHRRPRRDPGPAARPRLPLLSARRGGRGARRRPGARPGFYLDLARDLDARITTVFDTHIHADHISGARELAMASAATLRLSEAALERGLTYADRVVPVADGEELTVGGVTLRALALPGHTTDMTGLVIEDRALIGGDSLFADGIARPDLQRGDSEGAKEMALMLHATLHGRVLALGDDTVLLPCHAPPWGSHRGHRASPRHGPGGGPRAGPARS
ncbi:MAG: MBL fold metallo-hydrolase [Actinobacteria bacterium]|nr:MBL fold metallo-hydrolase [Actinomycetota bacterium]